jgi:hypothetical protein
MNKFFRSHLPYAETHYKFKLPWSPLFKPWPEIFLDGPSLCIPGVKPQFYLVIKDADFFPVQILDIEIHLQSSLGQARTQSLSLDYEPIDNLVFLPLAIDFTGFQGTVTLNGKITVQKRSSIASIGKKRTFLNANFPGLAPSALKINFLSAPLPYPPNWYAGELHCHSDYSNDPVEFGAPLKVLQKAGQSLGLGYVVCTDHSYDFYYQKTRYMQTTDPAANFQAYRNEALALNQSLVDSMPVMIPGEEVSCGNARGENVHLLVAGHHEFIPGHGDGGRRWLNNRPDLTIQEVIERLDQAPCFAAHPKVQVGALEKFIFRRGMWETEDVASNKAGGRQVQGLQFWNGKRGRDFYAGRAFWIKQLLAGEHLYPIGANDAHGDLNQNIGVKTPLFSLYQNRSHVFGNVRTVVHSKSKTLEGIQAGLASGHLFCTDGPALILTHLSSSVCIEAKSSVDFGSIEKLTLFAGQSGEKEELQLKVWTFEKDVTQYFTETYQIPLGVQYLRAEVETHSKKFAITSPIFLDP